VSAVNVKDAKKEKNNTGRYVDKSVQITGYEDGRERPIRPKDDSDSGVSINNIPEDPCCSGGGTAPSFTFVSSEGLGVGPFNGNPSGHIIAIRVIMGSSAAIQPSQGHIKLNADLNKGAGGKYINITFTRNPVYSYENDGHYGPVTYNIPLTNIKVESYTQMCYTFKGYVCDTNPEGSYRHMYKFDGTNSLYGGTATDLNDGAGGKYIFGHVSRSAYYYGNPIKEVGVLSSALSSAQPPSGWTKVPGDLNENAGGDYVWFCYKK
jgi:hypothetical protein